jgi:hypothetical protein
MRGEMIGGCHIISLKYPEYDRLPMR